jgi:hypothetical protein
VVSTLDWILAEFVRRHHSVSPDEAQKIVEELVTRVAPVVQDFDGFLKLLNPKLGASDQALVSALPARFYWSGLYRDGGVGQSEVA